MKERHYQVVICSLVFIILYQFILLNQAWTKEASHIEPDRNLDIFKVDIDFFKNISLRHGTDKVTTHHYEYLYGSVLGLLKKKALNFLEVGLGCGMSYGPGKSIPVWREYLPHARISIMEYNENCAAPFKEKVDNLFTGDQSDLKTLERVGTQAGPFDFIVDDGGHTRKQQVISVIGLWPYVAPKGVYVIEDFFTSFIRQYNDYGESAYDLVTQLIILMNNPTPAGFGPATHVFPNVTITEHARKISRSLLSISCFERACVLFKK